ncbi:RNA-directed DNA polymerase, eukaryota, reverse transcriptase zinc-binding domain protein, partial [Tanacetum coccineum]
IDGGLSVNSGLGLKRDVWENIIGIGFLIDKTGIEFSKSFVRKIMQWNTWLPKKVNIFIWRVVLDRLPHLENLIARDVHVDSDLCNRLHQVLPLMSPLSIPGLCKTGTKVFRGVCSVALWLIWKLRNAAYLSLPESREAIITSDPFA